jgi:hypothetical protein
MASLVMLVIIVGCAAFLYLKGTLVQSVAWVFNALFASFVAFAFFEMLAAMLMKYSPAIAAWAQMICLLLLFVLTFAILQTAALQIGKEKVDLGLWPERIGRVVCGVILGYVITGQLLVALATAPLPSAVSLCQIRRAQSGSLETEISVAQSRRVRDGPVQHDQQGQLRRHGDAEEFRRSSRELPGPDPSESHEGFAGCVDHDRLCGHHRAVEGGRLGGPEHAA